MSRKELLIAGLLLAVAVVGGASIPRLLASPAAPLGIALGPGPSRSVVQAPTIPGARKNAALQHTTSPHVQGSAAPVTPVTRAAARPAPASRIASPKRAAAQPPAAPVTTTPPATPPQQAPAAAGRNPSAPATPPGHVKTARGREMTPPGHLKTPPGHLSRAAHGKPTLTRSQPDLPGSGHGTTAPQAPPHPVGPHHRGVGHLPPHPARPAAATPHSRPQARPQTRGPRGQGGHGSPAPQVAQGHGHNGNGKGSGD